MYGIKVSKKGIDVETANDEDLVLNSQTWSPKIKSAGSFSVTIVGEDLDFSKVIYTHNLNYRPIFLISCQAGYLDSNNNILPTTEEYYFSSGYAHEATWVAKADLTKLYIDFHKIGGPYSWDGVTFNGHYWLLLDPEEE